MVSTNKLKEKISVLQEQIDSDAKLEMKALTHLEEVLELHEDKHVKKMAHAVIDIFEVLYDLEESEKKLVEKLEKKEHKIEAKEIKAILDVEESIANFRLLLAEKHEKLDNKLLDKLANQFKKKALEQHQEIAPKP